MSASVCSGGKTTWISCSAWSGVWLPYNRLMGSPCATNSAARLQREHTVMASVSRGPLRLQQASLKAHTCLKILVGPNKHPAVPAYSSTSSQHQAQRGQVQGWAHWNMQIYTSTCFCSTAHVYAFKIMVGLRDLHYNSESEFQTHLLMLFRRVGKWSSCRCCQ